MSNPHTVLSGMYEKAGKTRSNQLKKASWAIRSATVNKLLRERLAKKSSSKSPRKSPIKSQKGGKRNKKYKTTRKSRR
jgi:hypothetical protein